MPLLIFSCLAACQEQIVERPFDRDSIAAVRSILSARVIEFESVQPSDDGYLTCGRVLVRQKGSEPRSLRFIGYGNLNTPDIESVSDQTLIDEVWQTFCSGRGAAQ